MEIEILLCVKRGSHHILALKRECEDAIWVSKHAVTIILALHTQAIGNRKCSIILLAWHFSLLFSILENKIRCCWKESNRYTHASCVWSYFLLLRFVTMEKLSILFGRWHGQTQCHFIFYRAKSKWLKEQKRWQRQQSGSRRMCASTVAIQSIAITFPKRHCYFIDFRYTKTFPCASSSFFLFCFLFIVLLLLRISQICDVV